jgi:O-antigen/teichoic acid export membrane protein
MFHKLTSINQKLSPGLRKILGNVGWLFAKRVLTIIVSLTVGIYVIRYLGAENFGKLSYSISFVGLFSVIALVRVG